MGLVTTVKVMGELVKSVIFKMILLQHWLVLVIRAAESKSVPRQYQMVAVVSHPANLRARTIRQVKIRRISVSFAPPEILLKLEPNMKVIYVTCAVNALWQLMQDNRRGNVSNHLSMGQRQFIPFRDALKLPVMCHWKMVKGNFGWIELRIALMYLKIV